MSYGAYPAGNYMFKVNNKDTKTTPGTFIYDINLIFDDEKKFLIGFSNGDLLEGVVFKKNKDYCIKSMACYIDLTVGNTKLPNCAKIKQTSDLANAILKRWS